MRAHINDIGEILRHLKLLWHNVHAVRNTPMYVLSPYNEYFFNLLGQYIYMAVVDLAKLYSKSKNQRRSLWKLISRLRQDKSLPCTEAEVEAIEVAFIAFVRQHQDVLDQLDTLRDKAYAHRDEQSPDWAPSLIVYDLGPLIGAAEDFLKDIIMVAMPSVSIDVVKMNPEGTVDRLLADLKALQNQNRKQSLPAP